MTELYPYSDYKESGVDWIGAIPLHWGKAQLRRFVAIVNGGTPTPGPENWGGAVAWATPVDLNAVDGGVIETTARTLTHQGLVSGSAAVPARAVLLSTRAPIGYSAVTAGRMAFNQGCKGLVPRDELVADYLLFLVQAAKVELVRRGQGTTFLELSTGALGSTAVSIPPTSEQVVIAKFLDRETAEIDAFIADQEELIGLLAERRAATISHAVTKGLDPTVPMKGSGVDWLGHVPATWRILNARRVFAQRNEQGMADDVQLAASQEFGVIPQARYTELTGYRVTAVLKGFEILKHVEPGDFVISMRSFQGGLEYSKHAGKISSAYVMLTPQLELNDEYFGYLFKSKGYISALRATSNLVRDGQAMRFSNFAQVSIPVPPLEEQSRIAAALETQTSDIDAMITDAKKAIALSRERRAALISAAVTGKIDVREHGAVA